ncbi:MAG TPA: hypothetical protein VFJ52_04180, partial [Terriglobia bacterium]|nr:hypothetical protein [Terriglobia bacterium]
RNMKIRTIIFTVLLGCWLASPTAATTLVRMSLSQLAQASSTIVQGQVVAQATRTNAGHTRVFTYTTVQLEKALKGHPPATLTIQQPGGTVGNFHVRVPGTAMLRPGTQYVLFLEPVAGASDTFHLVGMMQGAFRVYQQRNGVQRHVVLPLGSLTTGGSSAAISQSPSLGEFQMTVSGVAAAPIVIPSGTSIPVVIVSTEFQGAGQAVVIARTTSDLFPSKSVVIPAGSQVVGNAQRQGTQWRIYWDHVSVRGRPAHLSGAHNEVSSGESLKGQAMVVQTR